MYLTYLWKKTNDLGGWILVLILFSHLRSHTISLEDQELYPDFREDGSWLFLVTGTSGNLNFTGHAGVQITCNKGTLTETSFFRYHFFYFCGHFLGVALTIKLLLVHSSSIWLWLPSWDLQWRSSLNWLEGLQRADDVRRWPCKSGSPFQGPVSSLLKVSANVAWKREARCTTWNPDPKCYWFPICQYLLGGRGLEGLQAKIIQDTCSGSLLAFSEGPWLSHETSASHRDFPTQLLPSILLTLGLDGWRAALQGRTDIRNNAFSAKAKKI